MAVACRASKESCVHVFVGDSLWGLCDGVILRTAGEPTEGNRDEEGGLRCSLGRSYPKAGAQWNLAVRHQHPVQGGGCRAESRQVHAGASTPAGGSESPALLTMRTLAQQVMCQGLSFPSTATPTPQSPSLSAHTESLFPLGRQRNETLPETGW